jgi:arylsulfatase A-like enzyme
MSRHPNIVFIVADDLGYADLSCTGQTDFETPCLDRLAAEGTRFTQAYANAPLCTNTRVAIMTGRYQYRLPVGLTEPLRPVRGTGVSVGLPPEEMTLPGRLGAAGYSTALIGKWHLGALPSYGPLRSGYQSFFGVMGGFTGYFTHIGDGGKHDLWEGETPAQSQGYVTHELTQRAIRWIEEQATCNRPYFLSLHYTAPHWPWSAPSNEEDARRRESESTQIAEGGSPRIYADMVTEMDRGIGQVMDILRLRGLDTNTLVIFTSDNGGERYSKNWPFVGRKMDLLEGGLRVPLIAWWPGHIDAGKVSDQVTISMDLTATCLDAAGLPLSELDLDGQSLLQHLTAGELATPRTLYWRMKHRQQEAVREGNWKYLRVQDRTFLFDLGHDWRERANFASEHPEILTRLSAQWRRWNDQMLPVPTDPEPPRLMDLSSMLW